jgi:peptide/nickel transport system substrate-binding protein
VRLARFEGHWGRRPAVREALLLQRDCGAMRAAELDGGGLDIVGTACPERLTGRPGWRVERRTGLYVKYLGMDVARARTPFVAGPRNPFHDVRVRRALSLAVDREALVRGLRLPARPAFQPVPMSVLGFNPRLVPEVHDPARARRLLAEAGFPEGFEVTLHVRSLLRQSAAALAADLAAVGVRADLEYVDDAEFSARLSRRESSLWLSRFGCVGGDASDLFEAFFGGVRRFSVHGGYTDAALERGLAESARSENDLERRDRLQQLVARLVHDLPLVPLYHDEDVYLIRTGLDWQPRNDGGMRVAEIGRR